MLLFVGAIIYTFRDTAGPIMEQLAKTMPSVIIGICAMTVGYHLMEGLITMLLAREYNPDFSYGKGVGNAFFCSFYRVATLGSGAGVAAVIYLGENGVEHSIGFGLYMLQYAFHKISIALFSVIFFCVSWNYMYAHFSSYMWLLMAGYAVTIIITLILILLCCSTAFHKVLFQFLDWLDRKLNRRFDVQIASLRGECQMLERASKHIIKKKRLVVEVILLSTVRNAFWYGIPYLIFAGHTEVTLVQTMAVTSLSIMLAAVIPAPGGIGSTELVFTSLFAGIVGTGLAGSAALLYRFATFIFPFILGLFIVIARRIQGRKDTYD
ncbi:MAG: lysylphosphatidylglycerol synthase transmembrane domain-containing protein [Clostridiales bacterium]|nr:flippase-like domain-containing protein [Roseburia sp.]MDD7636432.1 lysylphosphatidylglycerol synthase transmembrane domain-containing protein [Clostridiales bacterium]